MNESLLLSYYFYNEQQEHQGTISRMFNNGLSLTHFISYSSLHPVIRPELIDVKIPKGFPHLSFSICCLFDPLVNVIPYTKLTKEASGNGRYVRNTHRNIYYTLYIYIVSRSRTASRTEFRATHCIYSNQKAFVL